MARPSLSLTYTRNESTLRRTEVRRDGQDASLTDAHTIDAKVPTLDDLASSQAELEASSLIEDLLRGGKAANVLDGDLR